MQGNSTNLFGEPINPTHRFCIKCKAHKPAIDFRTSRQWQRRGRMRRWNICISCMRLAMKNYARSNAGAVARRKATCKKYGITLFEYDRLFASQAGACSICGITELPIDPRTGKRYELAIDHCHATGKVRSLLCPFCNNGLGCFKDRVELLQAAISYLEKHRVQDDSGGHGRGS